MSGFSNTGDRIYTSLIPQPYLEVYSRPYYAGDCVNLGANKAPGFSGDTVSNYIVFYDTWCPGDFDSDGDVDGSDLAELVAHPVLLDLSTFADEFGRTDCP